MKVGTLQFMCLQHVHHRFAAARVAGLLLAFTSTGAEAFVGELSFTPAAPVVGDHVFVHVQSGECDAIISNTPDEMSIVNQSVRVVLPGTLFPSAFCVHPIGTTIVDLGTFVPGEYAVTLVVSDPDNVIEPEVYRHGTFTVSARSEPPRVIPATHRVVGGVLALVLACVGAAAIVLRQRGG